MTKYVTLVLVISGWGFDYCDANTAMSEMVDECGHWVVPAWGLGKEGCEKMHTCASLLVN